MVEEKNSWSSTASSEATKREKVVTEMLSIHMLSSTKSALVAKNLVGNYTAATSLLAWAFLCPPPLWSIVPCANLRRSQAFIYLNAEVRMDIKCIFEDVDDEE